MKKLFLDQFALIYTAIQYGLILNQTLLIIKSTKCTHNFFVLKKKNLVESTIPDLKEHVALDWTSWSIKSV